MAANLIRSVVKRSETFSQTGNGQRPLAHVVGLLGIEHQHPVGDLRIGHQQRDDAPGAKGAHGGETVVAVRCPIPPLGCACDDQRIEEAAQLVDGQRQAGDVGLGEIALVGRRVEFVDGQRHEQLPVGAQRIAIGGQDLAAVGTDLVHQLLDARGRHGAGECTRGEAARLGGRLGLPGAGGAPGLLGGVG